MRTLIHMSRCSPRLLAQAKLLKLFAPELCGEPEAPAHAVQALTHYQTYPERPPGAEQPPKKVSYLDPMAPRSRQKRQLPEGPQ